MRITSALCIVDSMVTTKLGTKPPYGMLHVVLGHTASATEEWERTEVLAVCVSESLVEAYVAALTKQQKTAEGLLDRWAEEPPLAFADPERKARYAMINGPFERLINGLVVYALDQIGRRKRHRHKVGFSHEPARLALACDLPAERPERPD